MKKIHPKPHRVQLGVDQISTTLVVQCAIRKTELEENKNNRILKNPLYALHKGPKRHATLNAESLVCYTTPFMLKLLQIDMLHHLCFVQLKNIKY